MRGLGEARKGKAPRPAPLVRDPTLPPQAHQLPELDAICAAAAAELQAAGFTKVDYVAVRHADTLKVVTETGAAPAACPRRRLARLDPPHRQRRRLTLTAPGNRSAARCPEMAMVHDGNRLAVDPLDNRVKPAIMANSTSSTCTAATCALRTGCRDSQA